MEFGISRENVIQRVNKQLDTMYNTCSSGSKHYVPWVCCFCNELILDPNSKSYVKTEQLYQHRALFKWPSTLPQNIKTLQKYYKFNIKNDSKPNTDRLKRPNMNLHWLSDLVLSPRGCYHKEKKNREGFVSCETCKNSICSGKLPFWSINNQNMVGVAPECLSCLEPVELAMLTPVQTYGYVITYTGGQQKNL